MHPFILLVNGKLVREEVIDPEWSLAYFLREKLNLTGTKISCGQGGCGSCTVFISRYNSEENVFRHFSANSCITPLASVHFCHVTTIEHLGSRNSCHVIQEASKGVFQCGFCSPGMIMSMYAAVKFDPDLSVEKVKKAVQGNLCRCTGYRGILDAFKNCSLYGNKCSAETDIEDVGKHLGSIERARNVTYESDQIYDPELARIETSIINLKKEKPNSFQNVEFIGPKLHWLRPNSLIQLSSSLRKHPEAKLVSGCTSEDNHPSQVHLEKIVVIQINCLKELHSFEIYDNHICIGGGLTIAEIKKHLQETAKTLPLWKCRSIKSILIILQRFASPQIRNSATIGGCLTVDSSASDLQTLANALEFSALCFNPVSQAHTEIKSAFPASFAKSVIVNVKIPFTMNNEYTWAYKLSRRRFFDGAILNCATKTQVIPPTGDEDAKIFKINLAFGGSAIKRFSLLFTYGTAPKDLTSELFMDINDEIQREIKMHLNAHLYSIIYISALAKNLFKKFYEFLHDALHPSVDSLRSNSDELALNVLKATQTYELKLKDQLQTDLVWKPIDHESSYKHTTGEAIYCDDIPKYRNELALELVISQHAHAFLKKVDPTPALKIEGVVGFISHHDLEESRNIFGIITKDEEIFASEKVTCVGQLIGAIVAKDALTAKKAAKLVIVEYVDLFPRILTINDAIAHQSFFDEHTTILRKGDCDSVFDECEHVLGDEIKLGGQMHFYMEPQSAIAIPNGEDGEMEIIVATQNPAEVQMAVAEALGLNSNQITVRVKRIGGGFGGKDSRCLLVAFPVAIAAQKFGVSVRCILDRKTDMIISGKRDPFMAKYQVGFNSDGRILAIKMNIYSNAGNSIDASGVSIERAVLNLDNAYNIPNLDIDGIPCKTMRPSNTVMRAPGTVQGSHFIENILDRVSAHLNQDPSLIRQINMYKEGDITPYGQTLEDSTLSQCWEACIESSNYHERKAVAELFNTTQLYRKRGIYLTPCHFGIGYIFLTLNQAEALVNIYRDGSVILSHGGVEMGQGVHTKMIQIATRELGISASKIKMKETNTNNIPNATPTSASLTSDMNGMAIANACIILNERLAPYRKITPKLSWEEIISKAYLDRVNLSAVGFYKAPNLTWNSETKQGSPFSYFVSGACCSEVIVDCLTGEYQILRTDIVMDVGKSLNPNIDVGQIEGAFMQGVGLFTLEEMMTDDDGNLQTTGPLTYKIPTALDIPLEFNVSFLQGSSNSRAIYSSKSVGEPPLLLANSVYFAIKDAVRQFRKQLGLDTKFKMDSPATVEKVLEACNDLYEPLIV